MAMMVTMVTLIAPYGTMLGYIHALMTLKSFSRCLF